MKKDYKQLFSSPLARFSAYISVFVAILAATEIQRLLILNPRSDLSIVLFLLIMAFFIIIGTIFIGE